MDYPTRVLPNDRPAKGCCPGCLEDLRAVAAASGSNIDPSPGDYSICSYCGAVGIFQEDLTLRLATEEERKELEKPENQLERALTEETIAEYRRNLTLLALRDILQNGL